MNSNAQNTNGKPTLTVIIVSYNTRELTLTAIESLYKNTHETEFETIVFDNNSTDGSADAIEERFPDLDLVRSDENLGFARANNEAAKRAQTEWLLLLNPDTEVYPGAVDSLLAFAQAHPKAGIYGGQTVFPDGSLNIASCWNEITLWSVFCSATGLTALFPQSPVFNPEAIGGWKRDTTRKVDIVSGCFLLTRRALWEELHGFDLRFFMYAEEADLCKRAKALGYHPMITPSARIMHLVGASTGSRTNPQKTMMVTKARVTLIRKHWRGIRMYAGLAIYWTWSLNRYLVASLLEKINPQRFATQSEKWRYIWENRRAWIAGYPE